jgi:hypothetical protein
MQSGSRQQLFGCPVGAMCGGAARKVAGPEHGRPVPCLRSLLVNKTVTCGQPVSTPLVRGQGVPTVLLLETPGGRQATSHDLHACRRAVVLHMVLLCPLPAASLHQPVSSWLHQVHISTHTYMLGLGLVTAEVLAISCRDALPPDLGGIREAQQGRHMTAPLAWRPVNTMVPTWAQAWGHHPHACCPNAFWVLGRAHNHVLGINPASNQLQQMCCIVKRYGQITHTMHMPSHRMPYGCQHQCVAQQHAVVAMGGSVSRELRVLCVVVVPPVQPPSHARHLHCTQGVDWAVQGQCAMCVCFLLLGTCKQASGWCAVIVELTGLCMCMSGQRTDRVAAGIQQASTACACGI